MGPSPLVELRLEVVVLAFAVYLSPCAPPSKHTKPCKGEEESDASNHPGLPTFMEAGARVDYTASGKGPEGGRV